MGYLVVIMFPWQQGVRRRKMLDKVLVHSIGEVL